MSEGYCKKFRRGHGLLSNILCFSMIASIFLYAEVPEVFCSLLDILLLLLRDKFEMILTTSSL